LAEALSDADSYVRESAVMGLWKLGGSDAAPGLIAALEDQDPAVRTRAAQALEEIGGPQAVGALAAACRHDDVANDALAALTHILASAAHQVTDDDLQAVLRLEETIAAQPAADKTIRGQVLEGLNKTDPARVIALAQKELSHRTTVA